MTSDFERRTIPAFDRGRLRAAVEDAFTDLALHPERASHFVSGPPLAKRLRYTAEHLRAVPREAVASFTGVGNPWLMGPVEPGLHVLDIGCGAGTDLIIASHAVGTSGRVTGIDMTFAMVERAQHVAQVAGAANVRVDWGHAESLPVPDASVDMIVANAVVALTPVKSDTFREMSRVLRPGGTVRICDVIVGWRLPEHVVDSLHLWTDCIAGATWIEDYPVLLAEAGFVDVEIVELFDVFRGTTIEKNSGMFGARGANIRALKPS